MADRKRLRVAVVTQYFPTSTQPWAGHSAYQTLRPLSQLCDLQVFYPEASYPTWLTPGGARRPALDRSWCPPGVSVTYLPYPLLPVISRPLNGWVMSRRLLPAVRAFAPDLILNYVVYPDGFAALRIARALGVPIVLTAIGSDLNRMSDRLVASLTRFTLRHVDRTTTVSDDLRNTAIRLGAPAARTRAILNGCDTSIFHPRDRDQARQALSLAPVAEIVVYVGRLDIRKGLVELIEAMAQLRHTRPAAHCYLIGDGPDKSLLTAAIARHDLAAQMTLVPSCPTQGVAQWMAAADLVTLPSYREGCPNVVLEALAAGRPVVATKVGGIPELMDDTCGRLIPDHDAPALAQALEEVLAQSWSAEAISSRHSRSWADVAQDLYRVLRDSPEQASPAG